MIAQTMDEVASEPKGESALAQIELLDRRLENRFHGKFAVQSALSRQLVSFQANKTRPVYRWYKYKEGFSASLVEYLLEKYTIEQGRILDPFAGSGTTLFVANDLGIDADGIELLPIGQQIIATKQTIESQLTKNELGELECWIKFGGWRHSQERIAVPELRITRGAYPDKTRDQIELFLGAIQHQPTSLQTLLRFALLCILEEVSFTRKDGQYLRWDHRSGRTQGVKPFDKGEVADFETAITRKLNEIVTDLASSPAQPSLFVNGHVHRGELRLFNGSCLEIMPELPACTYDAIVTSPPYCNRYDYTRTYALELALLGVNEQELINLRQDMLSCTVENRAKDLLTLNPSWGAAINAADNHDLLQAILAFLDDQRKIGVLNNNGIPRMVRGYFYEMACVIAESARVMKSGALLFMVNDNVRYAGASISVDTILCSLAERLGFEVERIMVLPGGKGNSSQQMGQHGREPLRKCVYVWRKT